MILLNEEWQILMFENTLKTNYGSTIYFAVLLFMLIIGMKLIFVAFFVNSFLLSPRIKILIREKRKKYTFMNLLKKLIKTKRIETEPREASQKSLPTEEIPENISNRKSSERLSLKLERVRANSYRA